MKKDTKMILTRDKTANSRCHCSAYPSSVVVQARLSSGIVGCIVETRNSICLSTSAGRNTTNIIVVDAHESFRNMISDILGDSFQVVATASTGERAIQLAAAFKPDLILIDINLSGQYNGFLVGKLIIEQKIGVKVVFLTTFYEEQYVVLAKQIGALGLITKDNLSASVLHEILENT